MASLPQTTNLSGNALEATEADQPRPERGGGQGPFCRPLVGFEERLCVVAPFLLADSPMIAFPCPKCNATLKAPEERAGAPSKCPYCGCPVQVPVLAVHAATNTQATALPPPLPPASKSLHQTLPPPVLFPVTPPDGPRRLSPWVVPVSIAGGVLAIVAIIVGVVIVSRNSAFNTSPSARAENPSDKLQQKPSNSADSLVSKPPDDLVVIFQHSRRKSVAKLVRRGSPIPAGWEGGGGRLMSLEIGQREMQLGAMLSDGKEGETASLTK